MNRKLVSLGCAIALSANSLIAFAQQPVPDKGKTEKREVVISDNFSFQSDGNPGEHFTFAMPAMPAIGMGQGQAGFQYSFSTSLDTKVVKGKPYSADAVTEHIQTLGDGNRIVRRSTASVARSSIGQRKCGSCSPRMSMHGGVSASKAVSRAPSVFCARSSSCIA